MSRRGGFPGGMGGFGGMNINNLMKETKKMQADLEKSQAELAEKEFDATAGGGAITVKVSGQKVLKEMLEIYFNIKKCQGYVNFFNFVCLFPLCFMLSIRRIHF